MSNAQGPGDAATVSQHADKHRECKDCMDACNRLLPHLKKLAA